MTKNEMLLNATKAYEELLSREYNITVGKNQKLKSYRLSFTKDEYKHLFGLHKLEDRAYIERYASSKVFSEVMENNYTRKDIVTSDYFRKIQKRIENLVDIEKYLDRFTELYEWNQAQSFSTVPADILIANVSLKNSNENIYIFFTCSENGVLKINDFFTDRISLEKAVSFIVDKRDYTIGQTRPSTVLYKDKTDNLAHKKAVLIDRLSQQKTINSKIEMKKAANKDKKHSDPEHNKGNGKYKGEEL